MRNTVFAVLFLLGLSIEAQAVYNGSSIVKIGQEQILVKDVEHELSVRIGGKASLNRVYPTWANWAPSYFLQSFSGKSYSVYKRNVAFLYSVSGHGVGSMVCELNVISSYGDRFKTAKIRSAYLTQCDGLEGILSLKDVISVR